MLGFAYDAWPKKNPQNLLEREASNHPTSISKPKGKRPLELRTSQHITVNKKTPKAGDHCFLRGLFPAIFAPGTIAPPFLHKLLLPGSCQQGKCLRKEIAPLRDPNGKASGKTLGKSTSQVLAEKPKYLETLSQHTGHRTP